MHIAACGIDFVDGDGVVAVEIEEIAEREVDFAFRADRGFDVAQADIARQFHSVAEEGAEIEARVIGVGRFFDIRDFARQEHRPRDQTDALADRGIGVGRQREGVDLVGHLIDLTAQIFFEQIVAPEEEGRTAAQRSGRLAALEIVAERIADLRIFGEVEDIGAAATEALEVRAVPVAVATRPRCTEIAPIGEIGAARHAIAIGEAGPEARGAEEAVLADVVSAIEPHRGQIAFVAHLIVEQEPVEGCGRIGEIIGRIRSRRGFVELHDRGFAGIVDEQIGIGLHRGDEAVFGPARIDVLDFDIEAQAIGRFQIDIDREVFGIGVVFALEAQELGGDAEAAIERLGLRQIARLEDAVLEDRRRAAHRHRKQAVIVDQRERGEFVELALGFGPQIFQHHAGAAIGAFPLGDARIGLAIALERGGAHAGALRHDDRVGGREVAGVEIGFAEDAARIDVDDAEARAVERVGAIARIGDLRRVGAGDEFLLGIAELQAERADAGFPAVRDQAREAGRPFFGEIAVIRLDRTGEVEAGIVERLARDEIDQARNIAFDHVGADVLVDFHAAEQLGRDIVERQRAAAIGREHVAPVERRKDEGQAADDHV